MQGGPEMQSCCFHIPCRGYIADIMFSSNLCHKALESRDEFGLLGKTPESRG